MKLPPGDEQNDAKEVADRAAEALSAATVKEADAKEFWDRAVEAEERFSASTDPTLRTASGSMKAPGGKDIAAEEKRKADESAVRSVVPKFNIVIDPEVSGEQVGKRPRLQAVSKEATKHLAEIQARPWIVEAFSPDRVGEVEAIHRSQTL